MKHLFTKFALVLNRSRVLPFVALVLSVSLVQTLLSPFATWLNIKLNPTAQQNPIKVEFANASPLANPDLPDLVAKVLPGVVNISSSSYTNAPQVYGWEDFLRNWGVPQERKQTSLGSGFIISKNGDVITNAHVVEHASEVLVTLQNKKQYIAKIRGIDQKMDVALLSLRDEKGKAMTDAPAMPLGDSDEIRIAEPVFAVGNPFGLAHTVTLGIISAKNRTIGLGPFDNFLQTDASVNPGNSGGPLFNTKGAVVGVNTVIFSKTGQSGGLGFAIPIAEVQKLLPDLEKYGRVPRPWLGILGERVTPPMMHYYRLPASKGIVIFNLVEGGPTDEAGIHVGDIIVMADGIEIEDSNDLERALFKHKPRETIELKIRRSRNTLTVKVKLDELPHRLDNLPKGII